MSFANRFKVLIACIFLCVTGAHAQALPGATRTLQLSAFGGLTGTYTGVHGGRNIGITAGADLGFGIYFGLHPSVELRGTYPIDGGQVDSQKNVLAGLRVDKTYFRSLHPYGDILYGRGQINYENGGLLNPSETFLFIQTNSNVLSPGGGVTFDVTDHFDGFVDAQFQRYSTPVNVSGSAWAKALTVGVVYRFNFDRNNRAH